MLLVRNISKIKTHKEKFIQYNIYGIVGSVVAANKTEMDHKDCNTFLCNLCYVLFKLSFKEWFYEIKL